LDVLDGYAFATEVVGFIGGVTEGEHIVGKGFGFSILQLGSLCISKHRVLRLVVEESGFNRDALLRRVETAPEAEKVEESMRGIF
jgi:hypothetical protein